MNTALPQKFPFILDRNLAKANCTENHVCTPCDIVVLGSHNFVGRIFIFLRTQTRNIRGLEAMGMLTATRSIYPGTYKNTVNTIKNELILSFQSPGHEFTFEALKLILILLNTSVIWQTTRIFFK